MAKNIYCYGLQKDAFDGDGGDGRDGDSRIETETATAAATAVITESRRR
jgi:hypothetical protein